MSMAEEHPRTRLSEVIAAPTPPIPFTAHDLTTLKGMVASQQRRSARRAADNQRTGLAQELTGADADAVRAAQLAVLIGKLDGWLEMTWPMVNRGSRGIEETEETEPEPEVEMEPVSAIPRWSDVLDPRDRDEWIARSRAEGDRKAAAS